MLLPSGENTTEQGVSLEVSVRSDLPVAASHTFAVLSALPVTMRLPSGENATERTRALAVSVRSYLLVVASHTLAVLSQLPVSMRLPSGEKATEAIPLVCPLSVSRSR